MTAGPTTLVVLAAGLGSRFAGDKQLERLGPSGELLLDYSIYDAERAGFERVVIVTRPELKDALAVGRGLPQTVALQTLDDLPPGHRLPAGHSRPLGTAHAVWAARKVVEGPFAVVNADDFYGAGAFRTTAAFMESRADDETTYALLGYELRHTLSPSGPVNRAPCIVQDDWLQGIEEVMEITGDASGARGRDASGRPRQLGPGDLVSMNLWALRPSVFGFIEEALRAFLTSASRRPDDELRLPDVIETLVGADRARVKLLTADSRWCGLTHRADREHVAGFLSDLVSRGDYPTPLWG